MSVSLETGRRRGLIGLWSSISPSLVPFLAVVTAFLAGIPLITITVSDNAFQPDIAEGLRVSSTAYAALVESITGLTINEVAGVDDFDELRHYADSNEITTSRSLSRQARPFERVIEVGKDETRAFTTFFERYEVDEDTATAIAERIPTIREAGEASLLELRPLLDEIEDLKGSQVRDLAALAVGADEFSGGTLAQAIAILPALESKSTAQLAQALAELRLIDDYGQVSLERSHDALLKLDSLGIEANSEDADAIVAIVDADYDDVREAIETLAALDDLAIDDPAALGAQFRVLGKMLDDEYLTGESVNVMLAEQLDIALRRHLVIRRPGNRVLNADDLGGQSFGILKNDQDLEVLFLRLGDKILLFFPSNLEKNHRSRYPLHHRGAGCGARFQGWSI